jgi:hypothetical protein
MSESPLRKLPRLPHIKVMEHAEAIQKEINTELFMNEETQTIYFQKYYRTVLQYAYDLGEQLHVDSEIKQFVVDSKFEISVLIEFPKLSFIEI